MTDTKTGIQVLLSPSMGIAHQDVAPTRKCGECKLAREADGDMGVFGFLGCSHVHSWVSLSPRQLACRHFKPKHLFGANPDPWVVVDLSEIF
jgi:hypothetical protein